VVQLAAVSPTVAQPPPSVQPPGVFQALVDLDLNRFVIPPSVSQPAPTAPPIAEPSPNALEFEDAIINTYHAIEPWVRYGFELVTWGVGWVPWVGWLAPQIMIFYNFGERIVESLVVNSANWLWGPLPLGEGLANIAQDSWDALMQLGVDQWNFWLWPLPPLPFEAQQTQANSDTAETLTPADEQATPLRDPQPRRDEPGRPTPKHERVAWRNVASRGDPDVQAVPASEPEEPAAPDDESATSDEEKRPVSRKPSGKEPQAKKESTETSHSRSGSNAENDGRAAKRDSVKSPRHSSSTAE
jgi:hypothetical protein